MSAAFIFLIIIILVGAAIGGLYFLGLPPFNKTKRAIARKIKDEDVDEDILREVVLDKILDLEELGETITTEQATEIQDYFDLDDIDMPYVYETLGVTVDGAVAGDGDGTSNGGGAGDVAGDGDGTSNGGGAGDVAGDEDEVVTGIDTDQQYTEVNDKYLDGTEVAERSLNVNLDACKAICTGNPSCAQFFRTQGDECRYFNDTATQKTSQGGSIIYIKMQ